MEITLPFTLEKQVKSRLCWAAVGAAITNYYSPASQVNQHKLASVVFGKKITTMCWIPGKHYPYTTIFGGSKIGT